MMNEVMIADSILFLLKSERYKLMLEFTWRNQRSIK